MKTQEIRIGHIPAVLWGDGTGRLMIAVHGSHSSKRDECIRIAAEEGMARGYQVLSFDLPQHGERAGGPEACTAGVCIGELQAVLRFARQDARRVSLFACSMGAFFSLLAYGQERLEKAWLLSPVFDMASVIRGMMASCGVSEDELKERGVVRTPDETLYWDDYQFLLGHPVRLWETPAFILRGEGDRLCDGQTAARFALRFCCELTEQPGGKHWFHTDEQLAFFRSWLKERL